MAPVAPGRGRAFLVGLWGVLAVVFFFTFPRPFVDPGWPLLALALLAGVGLIGGLASGRDPLGRLAALLAGGLSAYTLDLHHLRTVAEFRPWAVSPLPTGQWHDETLVSVALLGLALTAGYAAGALTRYITRRSSGQRPVGAPLAGLALVAVATLGVAFLFGRPPITEPDGIQVQRVTTGIDSVQVEPAAISAGETAFHFVAPEWQDRRWWYAVLDGPTPVLERLDQGELVAGDFGRLQIDQLEPGESAGWYATLRPGSYEWQLVQPTFDEAAQTVEDDVVARARFDVRSTAAPVVPVQPGWVAIAALATYLGVLGLHLTAAMSATGLAAMDTGASHQVRSGALSLGLTALLWFLGAAWVELVKNPL